MSAIPGHVKGQAQQCIVDVRYIDETTWRLLSSNSSNSRLGEEKASSTVLETQNTRIRPNTAGATSITEITEVLHSWAHARYAHHLPRSHKPIPTIQSLSEYFLSKPSQPLRVTSNAFRPIFYQVTQCPHAHAWVAVFSYNKHRLRHMLVNSAQDGVMEAGECLPRSQYSQHPVLVDLCSSRRLRVHVR